MQKTIAKKLKTGLFISLVFVFIISTYPTLTFSTTTSSTAINTYGSVDSNVVNLVSTGSGSTDTSCSYNSNGGVYCLLAPIPGISSDGKTVPIKKDGLSPYLQNLYKFGIYISIGLAVLMIVIGGLQYVSTDAINGKDEGRNRITEALKGLVLALMAYLILNTLNTNLLTSDVKLTASVNLPSNTDIGSANTTGGGVSTGGGGTGTGGGAYTAGTVGGAINPTGTTVGNVPSDSVSGYGKTLSEAWGSSNASVMEGQTVAGTQTYYARDETHTDKNTQAGLNSFGQQLVYGNENTVGSAASNYYPPGTLISIDNKTYIIDDNNLSKQKDGSFKSVNTVLNNNKTVDLFTSSASVANSTKTSNNMTVLYVPPSNATASQITQIRTYPQNYIHH